MAIWYMDVISGNNSNNGNSPATAVQNFNGVTAAKGVVAGDEIRIKESPTTITSIGNCTWTQYDTSIVVPANITKNVDMCNTAWTAATNVTSGITTSFPVQEGTHKLDISIADAFTTGKIAYKTLAATEDFSAYTQLSFFSSSTTGVANCFYLALCSDTLGEVIVDTLPFSSIYNIQIAQTIDKGSALGSAIQSVALYASADPGACTISLDNIIACKDPASPDALSLTNLIGLNQGSMPEWFHIKSINGTTVTLGLNGHWNATTNKRADHFGASGSLNTYRLNGYILVTGNSFLGDSAVANISYSGGWDSATMSTQSGVTWFSANVGYHTSSGLFTMGTLTGPTDFKNVGFWNVLGLSGNLSADQNFLLHFENFYQLNNPNSVHLRSDATSYKNCVLVGGNGLGYPNGYYAGIRFENCVLRTAGGSVGAYTQPPNKFVNCTFYNTIPTGQNSTVFNCDLLYSTSTAILDPNSLVYSLCDFNSCLFQNDGINMAYQHIYPASSQSRLNKLSITSFNRNPDQNLYAVENISARSVTDGNRRTASGVAWEIQNKMASENYYSLFPLASVYVTQNKSVTIKVWAKRNHTGHYVSLYVPPQFGMLTPQESAAVSTLNSYQQLSLTITPTQSGVIEIFVKSAKYKSIIFAGSTLCHIDDVEII